MNNSRDNLSETLRTWRVTPPADPGFRAAVWRRVGRSADASWSAYLRTHPAAWSLAAVLAFGVAGFAGHTAAKQRIKTDRDAIAVAYLAELDPRVQAVLRP